MPLKRVLVVDADVKIINEGVSCNKHRSTTQQNTQMLATFMWQAPGLHRLFLFTGSADKSLRTVP